MVGQLVGWLAGAGLVVDWRGGWVGGCVVGGCFRKLFGSCRALRFGCQVGRRARGAFPGFVATACAVGGRAHVCVERLPGLRGVRSHASIGINCVSAGAAHLRLGRVCLHITLHPSPPALAYASRAWLLFGLLLGKFFSCRLLVGRWLRLAWDSFFPPRMCKFLPHRKGSYHNASQT